MGQFTLREKFSVGLVAVAVVALAMMLGVRMLGKTARFHYLERDHLALILTVQHGFETATAGSPVPRQDMLTAVDKARLIAGSV